MPDINIPQLPIDVIIHIMTYLSVSDRMSAGLVNQAWREASLAMKFINQQTLILSRARIDKLEYVLNILENSTRSFFHFTFKDLELKRSMSIWEQFGPRMRTLILICCDLSERTLVHILKCCDQLRVLHINACRECLMSGGLLNDDNDVKILAEKFVSLYELSLAYNRYLSDSLFNRLVAICPNLERLNLMGCQISFHSGLYKKFYPNNDINQYASESVLTFLNVLQYLTQHAKTLKYLNFGCTLIDGTALATLSAVKGLQLESLILRGCNQLTIVGIRGMTDHQTLLKVLDISFCTRITDASVVSICKNLNKLESLNIRRCRAVTDYGVQHIRLLEYLRELDISECEQLTGECITGGFYRNSTEECNSSQEFNSQGINFNFKDIQSSDQQQMCNENLEKLSANALNLDEDSIESIVISFPNLKMLEVAYCFSAITDHTIQLIFKELIFLRILRLSHCDKVSDAGLTGIGVDSKQNVQNSEIEYISHITEFKRRTNFYSRAVQDKNTTKLHKDLEKGVKIPKNVKAFSEFSLISLKGLTELDLSGCNKITDVSLKHGFAFPELRILDLSKCQQITHEGLDYLTKNNTAIEILNLTQCHNVSDVGIFYLSVRLCRLKQLYLQSCIQLTDQALDFIKLYCKSLQYLDARHCYNMSVASIESLSNIYVAYAKQIEDNTLIQTKPLSSPMPTTFRFHMRMCCISNKHKEG